MSEFTDEEKKRVNYLRHMLFDRMDTLSTPKAQNNNNDAITVLEKMMEECGIELRARADYKS